MGTVTLAQWKKFEITEGPQQSEAFLISKALKKRLDSEIFCLASERIQLKGTDLSGTRYVLFFHPEKEEPLSYKEFSFIKNYYCIPLAFKEENLRIYDDGRFFEKYQNYFKKHKKW